jgi:PIN domain nuclease of toxin-antitoxin system
MVGGARHVVVADRSIRHCRRSAVFVSAATAWEITAKFRTGKLPSVAAIVADLTAVLNAQGFIPLPISLGYGQTAGVLPGLLRDPFDLILIAQAMHDDMVLVSCDLSYVLLQSAVSVPR